MPRASANFTRPADTTPYSAGDLVANNTTGSSVVAMSFDFGNIGGSIWRAILQTSNATITNGSFHLWLFGGTVYGGVDPSAAPTNGDNGALAGLSFSTYPVLHVLPIILSGSMGSVGGKGIATYDLGLIPVKGPVIYGLLEARAAYVPANAEVFTVTLDIAP